MKTKIVIFSLLLELCFISSANAQFYVKLGGGYGLSLANGLSYKDGSDVKYASLGEGIYPSLGFGYMFNKNMAIELNGSYLIGRKFEATDTQGGLILVEKAWGEGKFISPALVVMAPMKNMTPYARFGGVIGIPKVKDEITISGSWEAPTGTLKLEESGKMALGVTGALGLMYKAGSKINIFAELYGTGMNYRPDTRKNTETFSGFNLEPTITYVETTPPGTNQEIAPSRPFSSWGLNVGFSYMFGKAPK